MPQYSDDLWLGAATGPQSQGWAGPGTVFAGVGPLGRVYIYDVVPAALSATAVVNAQAAVAAGNVALTSTTVTLSAARALTVKSSASGDTSQGVYVTGTDYWGQVQTEYFLLNGVTGVAGKKAFKTVTQVYVGAALAGNLSVGTLDVFGLPYKVTDAGYLLRTGWAGVVADNAGTFVAADAATPSNTTGDVRGTFAPTGASASDGARRLVIAIGLTAVQAGPNATQTGAIGAVPA